MHDAASSYPPADLKRWQRRTFALIWITYFAYYLCRYNMPVAATRMCTKYGWSEYDFGWVLSALTFMYAVGQFVNGQLADRFGTRLIASLGVFGSVVMNVAVYGLVAGGTMVFEDSRSILFCLTLFWGANGFFQAMGWAPMVRMMAHWYPATRRGKVMGFLGTCYQFGAAFSSLLAIFLTGYYVTRFHGDWQAVFLVPAALFAVVGIGFALFARNRPEDAGLPPVDPEEPPARHAAHDRTPLLLHNVVRTLSNPYLWIVAGSFFFLDFNRYGFVHWLPAYLDQQGVQHGSPLMENFLKITKICILPLGGSLGVIVAGWATDRFFGSRRAPVIAILLVLLGLLSLAFPFIPAENTAAVIGVVALIGFCTYGPHILMVGHAAQDFGRKSGAAGAAGFIDAMGYLGATAAGVGAGRLIAGQGYRYAFMVFGIAALIGALLAGLIWTVRPIAHTRNQ